MNSTKKSKKLILFFSIAILFAALLYWPILIEIFKMTLQRDESSHGLFIPFLSLYFIWLNRASLKKIEKQLSLMGLLPVFIAIFLYFFEIGGEKLYFQSLSFIVLVSGLLLIFLGKDFFKEVSFPVFYLICLIPIPAPVYLSIANTMRNINLRISTWILSFTNIPFLREDFCIHLSNSSLNVNISCSGIRYLLSFFVFGIAYAYLYRKKLADRLLVIGLTIPIAIFAGAIRLLAIFFSVYYIGPYMGEYKPHIIISWIVFIVIGMSFILLDLFIIKLKFNS